MGSNLKGKASEAADELRTTAQHGAEHVTEEGRSSADHVKQGAQPGSSQSQTIDQPQGQSSGPPQSRF